MSYMIDLNPQLKKKQIQQQVDQIIKTKMFNSLSDVKIVVNYLLVNNTPLDVINRTLKSYGWNFKFGSLTKSEIIEAFSIQKSEEKQNIQGTFDNVIIYEDEQEHLLLIDNEDERRLLFYFLIIAKWNNHPSWWVRYDRDAAFDFWEMNYNIKKREELIRTCCEDGLDLRVIGSKNPMVCFNLFYRMPTGVEVARITCEEDIKKCYEDLFNDERIHIRLEREQREDIEW